MNGDPQTSLELPVLETGVGMKFCTVPFWRPKASFQESLTSSLVCGKDDIKMDKAAGFLYRRDLSTLVPHVEHLGDNIIKEYLKCLAQYTNARRESDMPSSCNKIAMIGSADDIPPGLLLNILPGYSTIYVPIKVRKHWLLAVLYPGSLGRAKGRVEGYDSHKNWTSNVMTASNMLQFLKPRLVDEFNPADWTFTSQQCSRPQRNDADSGLYVLANAKSIALGLGMVDLKFDAQSITLRWQVAQELVTQSIVEAF